MRIVLVGRKDGERVIRWMSFLGLGMCLCLVMGVGVGGVFYLLSGRWSHGAVIYGIAMGVGVMMIGLIRGLVVSVDELEELD